MPQMAPLSWLMLYILFTIVFLMFCMMNYYMMIPQTPKHNLIFNKNLNSLNWKW
uniref:ATP synthase complex subunit 8 n=1 Tax=Asyndetus clavipes TaxID=2779313 RepID=A0A7U3N923_9MUSC|nr:ATP synthase F0 subunit 8 [Asyndetus clavipes]QOL12440.1 ATP synthase F0 subunit 8 [Asyndetus clavipes]